MSVRYNYRPFILTKKSDQIQRLALRPDHPGGVQAALCKARRKKYASTETFIELIAIRLPNL